MTDHVRLRQHFDAQFRPTTPACYKYWRLSCREKLTVKTTSLKSVIASQCCGGALPWRAADANADDTGAARS